MKIIIGMLFALSALGISHASDRNNGIYIDLKGPLKLKWQLANSNSPIPITTTQALIDTPEMDQLDNEINEKLFDLKPTPHTNSLVSFSELGIYQKISQNLEPLFKDLGRLLAGDVDQVNREFDLGRINSPGFEWQKPFGFFKVYTKRDINQQLLRSYNQWVIEDNFIVEIDVKSFLKKLWDLDFIETTSATLEAYANLKFHRKFQIRHYAETYEEALHSDYKKLFLPFHWTLEYQYNQLQPEEIVKISDEFFLGAEVKGYSVWNPYLEFSLNAKASIENLRATELQRLNQYRFQLKKSRITTKTISLSADLKAQIFSLIKISLLSIGFNSSITTNHEYTYQFDAFSLYDLSQDNLIGRFLNDQNLQNTQRKALDQYLIFKRKEKRKTPGSHFNFLIWDNNRRISHDSIELLIANKEKAFQKETSYSRKAQYRLKDKMKSLFLDSYLGFNLFGRPKKLKESEIEITYEKDNAQNLSLEIKNYHILSLNKNKYYEQAEKLIKGQTNLYPQVSHSFLNREFSDYIEIKQEIKFSNSEIFKILQSSLESSLPYLKANCMEGEELLKKCYKKSLRLFSKVRDHYQAGNFQVSHLRKFFQYFMANNQDYRILKNFFRPNNFSLEGSLKSNVAGYPFKTHFSSGTYKNFDIINLYLNEIGY
ncbi:MAG: hypothetical protein H6621_11410 [Halobacteriovoraceae bacterium]|nr:hypothetical protein [Halobacteriovoraceae bacterium]MCB9095667.1 hypothetical protein [Halobacteriovoraceae bacterium]